MDVSELEAKGLVKDGSLTDLGRALIFKTSYPGILSLRLGSDIVYKNPCICSHKHQRFAAGHWKCVDCGIFI